MSVARDERLRRVAPAWSLGVLAGGAGTRMGREKGTAPFMGRTLLEHAAERFAPPGVPVLASVRPETPALPSAWRRVEDETPDLGPLAGLSALLAATKTKFLFATTCDLPLLPADAGDVLLAFAKGVDAVLLRRGDRVEPFPALIASELAPSLAELLAAGARRADAWHERCVAAYVPFDAAFPGVDPEAALLNVNDPPALARAEALLRAEKRS